MQTQMVTLKSLALHYQIEAAEAAINACEASQVHAIVGITDSSGNTRLQMVGDGGNYNYLDEARRKARTAAPIFCVSLFIFLHCPLLG